MARIGKDEILNVCIEGIEVSFKEYLKWSSDEWLWRAPEYLLTVNIAKSLYKIRKNSKFLTLEDNVREVLKSANAKIKGQLKKKTRANGRSDIVFWWGKGTPRGIIEVKNNVFRKSDIQMDLDRIYAILEKKSDLEFGVITFYIDRHYEKKDPVEMIESRIDSEFIKQIESESKMKNFRINHQYKKIEYDEYNAAFAVAIMIHK